MPQPGEARIETVKINGWLEGHAGWPLLCTVLRAMRTRLSDVTTRVKEVREFPVGDDRSRMRVGRAECAEVSRDIIIHVIQKERSLPC